MTDYSTPLAPIPMPPARSCGRCVCEQDILVTSSLETTSAFHNPVRGHLVRP
eukprot:jgi/Mesvir1/3491/Mv25302-RA.1